LSDYSIRPKRKGAGAFLRKRRETISAGPMILATSEPSGFPLISLKSVDFPLWRRAGSIPVSRCKMENKINAAKKFYLKSE